MNCSSLFVTKCPPVNEIPCSLTKPLLVNESSATSKNGALYQSIVENTYKNANIDTVSVNISVLILRRKSLQARHFRNFYVLFTSSPNHQIPPISTETVMSSIPALAITRNSFTFSHSFICRKNSFIPALAIGCIRKHR